MSGFDINWLNLREPVDRRARNESLLKTAARFVQNATRKTVVDIGSGTGATFRAIAPLAPDAHWQLIDHDEKLLQEAARRHSQNNNLTYLTADLNDLTSRLFNEADLVTASALFDLCSSQFIENLVDHLVSSRAGLYAALNYNGEIMFDVPHRDDKLMIKLFNQHQQSDKGFGPALGPQSVKTLASLLTKRGYNVEVAQSDWLIDQTTVELHRLFVDGLAFAAIETDRLEQDRIIEWLRFRMKNADAGGCRVGHSDILALPSTTAI